MLKELPPELLAEIESTMPLCERVKMNKRKRSTVNEKPKYAEISSDEDNDSDEAFECKYHLIVFRNSRQINMCHIIWGLTRHSCLNS